MKFLMQISFCVLVLSATHLEAPWKIALFGKKNTPKEAALATHNPLRSKSSVTTVSLDSHATGLHDAYSSESATSGTDRKGKFQGPAAHRKSKKTAEKIVPVKTADGSLMTSNPVHRSTLTARKKSLSAQDSARPSGVTWTGSWKKTSVLDDRKNTSAL